jgi:hypothetical protein
VSHGKPIQLVETGLCIAPERALLFPPNRLTFGLRFAAASDSYASCRNHVPNASSPPGTSVSRNHGTIPAKSRLVAGNRVFPRSIGYSMFIRQHTWLPPFLGLVTCAPLARAEEGMVVSTARELAKLAFEDLDNDRYEESVKKFSQAYNIMRMPTLALGKARGLVKLGRLVEASELYLEVTRLEPTDAWQPIQREAQSEGFWFGPNSAGIFGGF